MRTRSSWPLLSLTPPLALAVAVAALLTTGCEKQPMNVTIVVPTTGADAALGQSAERGARLAYEQLQADGKALDLRLDVRDSASDPGVARRQLTAGFEAGAVAALGGVTEAEARALAPLADELERVVLSPSAADQRLSADHPHFYRVGTSAVLAGTTVANFAADELDLDSIALLARDPAEGDAFDEGLTATFERQHGAVVARVDASASDLPTAARQVTASKAQAVLVAGDGSWLVDAVVALRDAGFQGKIFVPQGLATPAARAALGAGGRGVLVASVPFDPNAADGTAHAFAEAYRQRWGADPDLFAAEAWDAMHMLASALENRPNLPRSVRDWLRDDVAELSGVTGQLQFDRDGSVRKYPRVYSVTPDLGLRDHAVWLASERQRIKDERQKIIDRMRANLSRELASVPAG